MFGQIVSTLFINADIIAKIVTLIGGILLVFGAILLAYDLFKERLSILRSFVSVVLPTTICVSVLSIVGFIIFKVFYHKHTIVGIIICSLVGAIIGTFNGLFADPDKMINVRSHYFRYKDLFRLPNSIKGLIFTFIYVSGADLVVHIYLPFDKLQGGTQLISEIIIVPLIGFFVGGLWHLAFSDPNAPANIPFFSYDGFAFSALVGFLLTFIVMLDTDYIFGIRVIPGAVISILFVGLVGIGILGGFTRFLFWKIEQIKEGRIFGCFGLVITLIGLLLVLTDPINQVKDFMFTLLS